MPAPRLPWHRLFGIALVEQFAGTPWRVELELELALRSQRLDIVLIERTPARPPARRRGCPTASTICGRIICSPTNRSANRSTSGRSMNCSRIMSTTAN